MDTTYRFLRVNRSSAIASRRGAEDRLERLVVPFVAGELVDHLIAETRQVQLSGPRLRPPRRILGGHPIRHRVWTGQRKALDEVQIFSRALKVALLSEVRRVDDERVAFPSAA